jgi:sterol desaturase/sphingolipid hydroxylase (fatty acid hydroxylase superfamily)
MYYSQFFITSILSILVVGGYTTCIDFSKKALHNKIQHNDKSELYNVYYNIYPLVIANILLIYPLSILYTYLLEYHNTPYFHDTYCTYRRFSNLFFSYLSVDFFFYVFHRLFHTRILYRFHYIHHRVKKPVGLSAFYAHPIDFIFSNIVPIYIVPIIFNYDYLMIHIYTALILYKTIYVSHGGICNISTLHDYHHEKFSINYGIGVFMDKLVGTLQVIRS